MTIYAYQEERRQFLQTRNGRTQDERLRVVVVDLKVEKIDLQLDGKCHRLGELFPTFKSQTKAEGGGGKRIRLQTDKQRREAGGLYLRGNVIEWQADEYRKKQLSVTRA